MLGDRITAGSNRRRNQPESGIIRPKYALPKAGEGGIRIAPLPESLLTRYQADESFLADILAKKFCDHLPLYRISEVLGRQGNRY